MRLGEGLEMISAMSCELSWSLPKGYMWQLISYQNGSRETFMTSGFVLLLISGEPDRDCEIEISSSVVD